MINRLKEWYPRQDTDISEYKGHINFFEKSLTEISQKIAITDAELSNSAVTLPDNVSKTPSNSNQVDIRNRLNLTMLNRGILAIRIPLDPLLKAVLPKRPIGSSYKSQPLKASIQFKMRSKMAAFLPDKALRNCLNVPEEKVAKKISITDEKHAIKLTNIAKQADTQDSSEKPVSSKVNDSNQADNIRIKSDTSKSQAVSPAIETSVNKTATEEPRSIASKEKEPVIPQEQASLSNNNLMVLLYSQSTSQIRPAVTFEKPIENLKQAFLKKPTLEEFFKKLEKLLDEMKELSSNTAEEITVDSKKTQDSDLLMKLKKLKLHQFIQQQLTKKDPCNAKKDIHQRLEKIKALHDSLQNTQLETNDVNEALKWLSSIIEDLTQAEKKAAEKCAKFQRTFVTVNS